MYIRLRIHLNAHFEFPFSKECWIKLHSCSYTTMKNYICTSWAENPIKLRISIACLGYSRSFWRIKDFLSSLWFTYASCEFEFISHCLQKRAASHILSWLSRDPRTIPFTFKLFICSRRSSKVKRAINLRPPCSTALAALQYKKESGREVLRILLLTKSITSYTSTSRREVLLFLIPNL